jgi:hypothetical protein
MVPVAVRVRSEWSRVVGKVEGGGGRGEVEPSKGEGGMAVVEKWNYKQWNVVVCR